MHQIIIRSYAEDDITNAAIWYNQQQRSLGDEFLTAIEKAINRAAINPFAYQRLRRRPDVRRVLTKPFPYRIFFILESKAILVIRVLHNARDDREWKKSVS